MAGYIKERCRRQDLILTPVTLNSEQCEALGLVLKFFT